MMKIGIIGCGKIADSHAEQIKRIPRSKIIAACDKEILMAEQFCERFNVKFCFDNVNSFFETRPDVVHITTPTQSHSMLGKLCLDAGCHVYIEKPFTIDSNEAVELIEYAKNKGLKLTVGHDDQFTHAARKMRKLVKNGFIGDYPFHMESYYCYDLGDQSYAKSLLGDKNHWVRELPGKLLHNIINHGVSKIAEFIDTDDPFVYAKGYTSSFLKKMGEKEIIDELRVIICNEDKATAYFTVSTQFHPILHGLRIFGTKNGVIVDHDQQTCIKVKGDRYKSYLEKFVPSFQYAYQYLSNGFHNINLFLKNDFHMKSGMKYLIESFYHSILYDSDLPIPYKEIILTTKIMDRIFNQIYY